MSRKSLSRTARARIFKAHEGRCHICGSAIQAGVAWDVEHRTPLSMGGADDESNMAPAHRKGCHADKSRDDARNLAKAKRNEARHYGFAAPKRPIKSPGFTPTAKQARATAPLAKALPRRSLYAPAEGSRP